MIFSSVMDQVKPEDRSVRLAIEHFEETGESGPHSPYGAILCHVLNHCIEKSIDFELKYMAGFGYYLYRRNFLDEVI